MACTFFKAMGLETGKSLVEADRVDMAKELLERGGDKLILPHDAMVAPSLDAGAERARRRARRDPGRRGDVRHRAATRRSRTRARSRRAKTVLWNGPMGVFETPPFDAGTRAVAEAMAERDGEGRDDDRRRRRFGGGGRAGWGSRATMSHVSTGGGASLEFLEGKTLPGVAALDDSS